MAVRYTAELADRATAYLALPTNSKRQPAGLEELAALWAAIQGQPASTCRQCQFSDYQRDVAAYVREFNRLQNPTTVADSTYQIAPEFAGQSFVHEDLGAPVTAENLTDETAEFLISKGYDKHFVKVGSATAKAADAATTEVTPEHPLVPQADLETEQGAHKATKTELQAVTKRAEKAEGQLEKETAAHSKASEALKAEKEAHKATKAENSDLQKQVKDLQKQLDKLTTAAEAAAE